MEEMENEAVASDGDVEFPCQEKIPPWLYVPLTTGSCGDTRQEASRLIAEVEEALHADLQTTRSCTVCGVTAGAAATREDDAVTAWHVTPAPGSLENRYCGDPGTEALTSLQTLAHTHPSLSDPIVVLTHRPCRP